MEHKQHVAAQIPVWTLAEVRDASAEEEQVHHATHQHLCSFYGHDVGVHRHDQYFQLHYIRRGKIWLCIDDSQYDHDGALCFLTPPGVPHAFRTDTGSEGEVITIRQQLVWQLFMDTPGLRDALGQHLCIVPGRKNDAQVLDTLFTELVDEIHTDRAGRQGNIAAQLRLILMRLLRSTALERDRLHPHQDLAIVHRFAQLIEEYSAAGWQLEQYASRLGVTTARLNLLCRRQAGMSAKQMVHARQLQEARRLLIHSTMPVSQVGFTLGYADPAYFSRFFARQVGMSPTDFRRHHQERIATLRKVQAFALETPLGGAAM